MAMNAQSGQAPKIKPENAANIEIRINKMTPMAEFFSGIRNTLKDCPDPP
jgi:hypothetical protein